MYNTQEKILEQGVLEVAVPNVQSLSHEDYALVRKDYLGASDSSVICGVNLYKNVDQLIKEKNAKYITAEEKAVGEKPIVKKGYDLEPIILDKAAAELCDDSSFMVKPDDMFKFKLVDGLSVNYDGVLIKDAKLYPVEAKLVSTYGEKYYNKTISFADAQEINMKVESTDLVSHIKKMSTKLGIPAYYYTQVQQEIAGLNADHGYLAALFDNSWTFKLYYIPRDDYVILNIYNKAEEIIKQIKRDTH